MRRFCVLSLLILGTLMIITGIAEAAVHPTRLPEAHILVAGLFVLVSLIHIIVNRKAVGRYLKGK